MWDLNAISSVEEKLTLKEINDVISALVKVMFIDRLNTKNPFPHDLYSKIENAFNDRWELVQGEPYTWQFDASPVIENGEWYSIYWEDFTLDEIEKLCMVYWDQDSIEWVKSELIRKKQEDEAILKKEKTILLSEYLYQWIVFKFDEEENWYVNEKWDVLTIKWYKVIKVYDRWNDTMVHVDNPKFLWIPIIINSQWIERYALSPLRVIDYVRSIADWINDDSLDPETKKLQLKAVHRALSDTNANTDS